MRVAKRDQPARAVKRGGGQESRKGKGRARTRAGGLKIIDDPSAADKILSTQLSSMGLYAAHTLGDGNCLFRALSDQLHGTPANHLQVRANVCDYLANNEAKYASFVDVDELGSWEGHLREMRKAGTYGGHLELSAFAHLHHRPIKVIQPGLVYVIGHEDESPAALKRKAEKGNGWADNEEAHTGDTREEEFGEGSPLYIIYHQWEHYSSVRNIDGPHNGLPRIRERKALQSEPSASASYRSLSAFDAHPVSTSKISLLRRSLPLGSAFTDSELSQMLERAGSWEKALQEILDNAYEEEAEDLEMKDAEDGMPLLPTAPTPTNTRARQNSTTSYREPSPASSSISTVSVTLSDSNAHSSSGSTDPSSTSVSTSIAPNPPLGKKAKSRSRSPEPVRETRRQRRHRASTEDGDESGFSDATPSRASSRAASSSPIAEHINTVRADLDIANEQPTRLRPRGSAVAAAWGARRGGAVLPVGEKEWRAQRTARRTLAQRAVEKGREKGSAGKGEEAVVEFKELRV